MLEIDGVTKVYGEGDARVKALDGISLKVEKGEFIALVGHSGSGKSTLLNIIGGLDRLSSGSVALDGQRLDNLNEDDLVRIRREKISYVFQQYHLLPSLSALENVLLPLTFSNDENKNNRAMELLERMGLSKRAQHRPSQLSGGEQQRVAIARSLALEPKVMLFDEPTSALDPELTTEVLDVIGVLADEGMTMMIVTHELEFARRVAHRIAFMDRGEIIETGAPADIITNPQHPRTKGFMSKLLHA